VKVLLDECVDRRFAHDLVGHEVNTVPRRGWAGIKNGDLLALAGKEFDTFITVDRKPHPLHRSDASTIHLSRRSFNEGGRLSCHAIASASAEALYERRIKRPANKGGGVK
jgi:Domain of unknown function (DUF5615)